MLGNFDFMFDEQNQEYYSGFSGECAKAEEMYAMGEYGISVMMSRKAIELMVRWAFEHADFNLPRHMADSRVTHWERLNDPSFFKWLRNRYLYADLDTVRKYGNDNVHENVNETASTALFCLKTVFELVLALEKHLWEDPYTASFFEPVYEQDEEYYEGPAEADYLTLIKEAQQSGDACLAVKWALLNKLSDRSFDMSGYLSALPENTSIGMLVEVLSNGQAFRALIQNSSIRLNKLISDCYGDFNVTELLAVSSEATRICRRLISAYINKTDACLAQIDSKLEALKNGK